MRDRHRNVVLHVASPSAGNDVNSLIRELAALDGIRRVVPMSRFSRVLLVEHDRSGIAARTLLERVRRGWSAVRLVGV